MQSLYYRVTITKATLARFVTWSKVQMSDGGLSSHNPDTPKLILDFKAFGLLFELDNREEES